MKHLKSRISNFEFRIFLALSLLLLAGLACGLGGGTPPVESTNTPAPAESLPSNTPRPPTPVPSPTATATFRVPVVDSGAALAPQVVEQQPAGGSEMALNGEISLTFDQPMDEDKTSAALVITGPDGGALAGKVSWPSAKKMVFTPDQPFKSGETYQARLGDSAASELGVQLIEPVKFNFQAAGVLEVAQVFPVGGSTEVASESVITVIFNRPVVPLIIVEEMDTLPQPLSIVPELPGVGEWVNTSTYVYRPRQPLRGFTTYEATVRAGLTDALGDPATALAQDFIWQFTTVQPRLGNFWLVDGVWEPEDGYANVPLQQAFALSFLQPMDRANVESNLSITSSNSENVPLETRWSEDSTTVVFTPTVRMALNGSYVLVLHPEAQDQYGGELREGLRWNFFTVNSPGILATYPENGSVEGTFDSRFSLYFVSPMDLRTLPDRVTFDPPIPSEKLNWYYSEWQWSLDFYGLSPSTRYTVHIAPGMADPYGNEISDSMDVSFTTGGYAPSAYLMVPWGTSIYRTDGDMNVYARSVNVSAYTVAIYRISTRQYSQYWNWTQNIASAELVTVKDVFPENQLNKKVMESIPLTDNNGNPLPPGFYALGLDSPYVTSYGRFVDDRVIMVANANLTLKTAPGEALAWVTDLTSGEPLGDVPVELYAENFELLDYGMTNADGLVHFTGLPLTENPYSSIYARTGEGRVFAFADSADGSGVSPYDFGIWEDYYIQPNQSRAYLYTDRPLYRPGQPVYFKGIVRFDDDLAYSLPTERLVHVSINSYDGSVYEEDLSLSADGTFEGELTLDNNAALGYYTIAVNWYSADPSYDYYGFGSVGFSVAEYRKPEYLVEVTTTPEDVLNGDTFDASVFAEYFSGGGVADAEVFWTLRADPFNFSPPEEFYEYNFTDNTLDVGYDYYGYDYTSYPGSEIIAEGSGRTDVNGEFTVSLPASLSQKGTSQTLTFEASITDIAQTSVSGRASVTAHQSMVYPGVKPRQYVGTAGKEQTFDIILLDWDGKRQPGRTVTVDIVERRWNSVQKVDESGRITWETSVEEIPVAGFPMDVILDSQGEAAVNFTPPNGGVYRALVSAADDFGNVSKASAYFWVAGEDYIPWRQTNDRSFQLVADKTSYNPGDTAEILIASPFQGQAYALVTVERGHIRQSEVLPLDSNSTIYRLPIRGDMAPNIYLSVLIIKGVDETNPHPDFRLSMTQLNVDTSAYQLNVELSASAAEVGPRDTVVYTIRTTDVDGNPVSADVSLSLVDLAVLTLSEPNTQPILNFFYSERALSVRTSVPIVYSIEFYNAQLAAQQEDEAEGAAGVGGYSGGGGKGGEAFGVFDVRGDFRDTAYWAASIRTDASGMATVSVTLPDNLTTWRMDARAATEDTRVGDATLDIVSTKPLLVRPQAPRFFVQGDEARLGSAVHNNTDASMTVEVALDAQGLTLHNDAVQTVEIPARQQAFVTWDVTVNADASRVDLVFSAQSGDYSDASRPTLGTLEDQGIPVYRYEAPETVGTAGMIPEEGTRVEGISLPADFPVSAGTLTIEIEPSLAAAMTEGLSYLEHYPYECTEQIISKFLPNVLTTRALQNAGVSDTELEARLAEQVSTALQRLYNEQNADGGWGWWGIQESSPLTSAYVIFGLVEADDAGYAVDGDVLLRGISYLRRQVMSYTERTDPYLLNRQAFVLFVLSRARFADVSHTVQLYNLRGTMSLYARAYLAVALHTIDPEDPRLDTLISDFNNAAIVSATGTHWEENYSDWWNWNTDTRTTAVILGALTTISPDSALNPNAVRWLMAHRVKGYWASTQETAWSLIALTNWMVASGELEANYAFGVALNNEMIGDGEANADNLRETTTFQVDIARLLVGEVNRLAIARDAGGGNLYYTAHLTLDLPVEQIQPLDRGFTLSRSYFRLPEDGSLGEPVTSAVQGEMLFVRLTVVVPHALHYVVIDDPLPAGLEAVDQSLLTSVQNISPENLNWDDAWRHGWGWWYFSHIERRDERVVLSADYLPAGTYVYTYMARASTVGTFKVIPPTGQEFYFPEVYGRGAGSLFVVEP